MGIGVELVSGPLSVDWVLVRSTRPGYGVLRGELARHDGAMTDSYMGCPRMAAVDFYL